MSQDTVQPEQRSWENGAESTARAVQPEGRHALTALLAVRADRITRRTAANVQGTIKRHIAGKGNADKAAVIAAVRRLGFAPADDNEADALALLNWAIAQKLGGAR